MNRNEATLLMKAHEIIIVKSNDNESPVVNLAAEDEDPSIDECSSLITEKK